MKPFFKGKKRFQPVDTQALKELRALLGDQTLQKDQLIEYLHLVQDHYGYLSEAHLRALANEMHLSTAEVYEVASFYHHFDVVLQRDTPPPPLTLRICDSISCEMQGSEELVTTLSKALGKNLRVQRVPCVGRCESAPVAVLGTHAITHASTKKVLEWVEKNTHHAGLEDYIGYQRYLRQGGYKTLENCLAGKPNADYIIATMEDSGLRGLGGAGFPLGQKWRIVRKQPAPRLMAVNIDEGEPGTFKDRYYLERDPHRFIEGMLIAAHVVGIDEIYVYLRDEYAGIRQILTQELEFLKKQSPHPLPKIHLRRGAGAYICGEESAMIESIEGKRGMPRLRPPFVAEVGLFGRPTLEHNMESLYWVTEILEKGADWFAAHGRHNRKGLRSFSVSGRVQKPGVHLAPAGITIRELIDEYCKGMLPDHAFYAYLPGGASGGILPAEKDDIPLDFDTLNEYGCFIGSAAVIVLSDKDQAKTAALNAMRFFEHESCGQCTPCRVGTSKMRRLMEKPVWDQSLLIELAEVMKDASICGLGQAAPNPMECVIKYFPQEIANASPS